MGEIQAAEAEKGKLNNNKNGARERRAGDTLSSSVRVSSGRVSKQKSIRGPLYYILVCACFNVFSLGPLLFSLSLFSFLPLHGHALFPSHESAGLASAWMCAVTVKTGGGGGMGR